jgi:sterol desaturase/sphingolipid hydroxylase (fatty acid hydroxylase superfamily)
MRTPVAQVPVSQTTVSYTSEYLVSTAEPLIRTAAFATVLLLLIALEIAAPRRSSSVSRWERWPGNLGLVAIDTLLVRIVFPGAAVGVALIAEANRWGLLNQIGVSELPAVIFAVIALDLVVYAQHVAFHALPWLWPLHRVHHSDLHLDATTGLRFHPGEIVLSMALKLAAVVALGAPALAVMIFEVLLNATAMFSHSNIWLPEGVDRAVRRLFVTPDMHRVHHSTLAREAGSNFGFNLAVWDRLFGTYTPQPELGHERMTLGVEHLRHPRELRLDRMLLQPLRRD